MNILFYQKKEILLAWLLLPLAAFGQLAPIHIPVVGGVSPVGARVQFAIQFHASAFKHAVLAEAANSTPVDTVLPGKSLPPQGQPWVHTFGGLKPDTRYRLTTTYADTTFGQEFSTFPLADSRKPFKFGFGSCLEHTSAIGDSIYISMAAARPDFFLEIGDWTYPDHDSYPSSDPKTQNIFYTLDTARICEAYQTRYTTPNAWRVLGAMPVDYIPDDDDYVFDDNWRYGTAKWRKEGKRTVLKDSLFPPQARPNAIRGYTRFFPAYQLPDTAEGLYHRIRYGNTEIFVVDSRADRTSNNDAFVAKGKSWKYRPKPGHTVLGRKQMDWLIQGLMTSDADWKFIATGTNFNMGYKRVLDIAMTFKNFDITRSYTGMGLAASLSCMWFAYPQDQARLINTIRQYNIRNVIVLSGDAHSASIDDGKNAGLPEFMAGCLGTENSRLPYILRKRVGINIWNKGGQGVGNDNYLSTWGQVEVFGADSVRMRAIDTNGDVVISYTRQANAPLPKYVNAKRQSRIGAGARLRAIGTAIGVGFREAFKKRKKKA